MWDGNGLDNALPPGAKQGTIANRADGFEFGVWRRSRSEDLGFRV